jgi:hypothetical protein
VSDKLTKQSKINHSTNYTVGLIGVVNEALLNLIIFGSVAEPTPERKQPNDDVGF